MKKWYIIITLLVSGFGFTQLSHTDHGAEEVKTAVVTGIALLQSSSHTFLANAGGCHSCHGQGLGGVAFALAREKGFAVADTSYDELISSITTTLNERRHYLAQNQDPVAIVIGGSYDLWALKATHTSPDKTIELLAKNLLQRQRPAGNWISPNARPPMEYYSFSATALALNGIQHFLPAIFQQDIEQRKKKAIDWMIRTKPETNEEKVFQLLGLTWTHSDQKFIWQQAKQLLSAQQSNGGWSQLDSLSTDAYATGQSLYALQQCGYLPANSTAYQKGVAYLVRTQEKDGSWNVQTRSFPSVPFVDSGFPHGDNQFISAAATNWAVMALLVSL